MLVLNTNQNEYPTTRSNSILVCNYPDMAKSVILLPKGWEFNIGSNGDLNIHGTQCFIAKQIDVWRFYWASGDRWPYDLGAQSYFLFPNTKGQATVSRITTSWVLREGQIIWRHMYFDLYCYTKSTSSSQNCQFYIKIRIWVLHPSGQIDYHRDLIDETVSSWYTNYNNFVKTYILNTNWIAVNEWDRVVAEIIGWKVSWGYGNDRYFWIWFGCDWSADQNNRPHGIQISVE